MHRSVWVGFCLLGELLCFHFLSVDILDLTDTSYYINYFLSSCELMGSSPQEMMLRRARSVPLGSRHW